MPSWTSHGPLSIQGGIAACQESCAVVKRLTVIDGLIDSNSATISASTAEGFGGQSILLQLASGSDCVVLARAGNVPDGQIALSPVQQYNLRIKAGSALEFGVFRPAPDEPFELVDVEAEVSVLVKASQPLQVDATELARQFLRQYFGRVVAVNEACMLQHAGHQLLLRVAATNTLSPEEQEECLGYHCYRGLVTPDTQVYLVEVDGPEARTEAGATSAAVAAGTAALAAAEHSGQPASSGSTEEPGSGFHGACAKPLAAPATAQSTLAGRGHVHLLNARKRDATTLSRNSVRVVTNDGEWFPVRRKLLRPCIAMTKAVRSEDEADAEVAVDVDTLTFDRVLIFLEAEALCKSPPGFGVHVIPPLLEAAQKLGLRSLEDYCRKKLGDMESRMRWFSFDEIQQRNSQGECLLILDGMVLDVTRWLPEHPGGATIIPKQSLNIDCSRFFELYHHSRESFLYLQEFYVGEVLPEDRVDLPREEPSSDFLQQLRGFTTFRMQQKVHTHLGASRA